MRRPAPVAYHGTPSPRTSPSREAPMRRVLVAAAALLGSVALTACGPNASELEPGLKSAMRDLAKAIVVNDQASKDFVQNFVLVGAGQHGNPVGAKDAD